MRRLLHLEQRRVRPGRRILARRPSHLRAAAHPSLARRQPLAEGVGARLFEAPRALLRVYAAGAACPVRPDARFAAAVDERKCVPLVTPVAVVAKGKTLLALYSRFLEQGGPLKPSRDAQALGGGVNNE